MSLLPYDPEAKCPKCGYDYIFTAYVPAIQFHCDTLNFPNGVCTVTVEHHHRSCQRCHYTWAEDVVRSDSLDLTGEGPTRQGDSVD